MNAKANDRLGNPPIGPLCVLLFKNLEEKNFYKTTEGL
jgi:hypothetical protein